MHRNKLKTYLNRKVEANLDISHSYLGCLNIEMEIFAGTHLGANSGHVICFSGEPVLFKCGNQFGTPDWQRSDRIFQHFSFVFDSIDVLIASQAAEEP